MQTILWGITPHPLYLLILPPLLHLCVTFNAPLAGSPAFLPCMPTNQLAGLPPPLAQVCDALEDMMAEGGCLVDYHGCDFFPER